jgi:site-specific recombinase XerD
MLTAGRMVRVTQLKYLNNKERELLGHNDPSTTQIYAEMDKTTVKEAHRKHMSM